MNDKLKGFLKDLLEAFIIAIVIVALLFKFVLMSVEVSGSSMEPTLCTHERGMSFIITRNIGIKRFDICVIGSEKATDYLVKRVIGLPNETIEYIDNKLYVNGEYVEENFLSGAYTGDFKYTLGDDEYFCLGDNRNVSRDSRYYGPFNKENIKATHIFIYYPFALFGFKK